MLKTGMALQIVILLVMRDYWNVATPPYDSSLGSPVWLGSIIECGALGCFGQLSPLRREAVNFLQQRGMLPPQRSEIT